MARMADRAAGSGAGRAVRSKAAAFEPELAALAGRARALGHPARLAILRLLARRGGCACGQIVDALPLAQATVSQHLRVLKRAGLVRGRADGLRSDYRLDWAALDRFDGAFAELLDGLRAARAEADRAGR